MHLHTKTTAIFSAEMIISVFAALSIQSIEIFNTKFWSFLAVLAVFVLIWVLFFADCKRTLFLSYMFSDKRANSKYFKLSLVPLTLITAAAAIIPLFDSEPAYTYLFLPFKLFAIYGMYKPFSALLCGILFTVPVFAAYFLRPDVEETENDN